MYVNMDVNVATRQPGAFFYKKDLFLELLIKLLYHC